MTHKHAKIQSKEIRSKHVQACVMLYAVDCLLYAVLLTLIAGRAAVSSSEQA